MSKTPPWIVAESVIKLPVELRTNPAFFCCNYDAQIMRDRGEWVTRACSIKDGLLKFFRFNS